MTSKGGLKKLLQGSFREPGSIYMYFTPWGYVLAISTDQKDKYSHISIHAGIPISGFGKKGNLANLLSGPSKLTNELGIDKQTAEILDGKPTYVLTSDSDITNLINAKRNTESELPLSMKFLKILDGAE